MTGAASVDKGGNELNALAAGPVTTKKQSHWSDMRRFNRWRRE